MQNVSNEIGIWAREESAQQPILLLSHSQAFIDEICAFARRAAVCETRQANPCGICAACKQADAGTHPDTITILGEKGRITIKDIASLRTILTSSSDKRMICIPHAEDILPEAANALLKTLEEPSTSSRFLLIAPAKRSVLPTIRSRCRILFTHSTFQEKAALNTKESLDRLSSLRVAEPFSDKELTEISRLVHIMIEERGASPELFRVSQRLRDYYKTASFPGGNTKLAADILLASLSQLRNTKR